LSLKIIAQILNGCWRHKIDPLGGSPPRRPHPIRIQRLCIRTTNGLSNRCPLCNVETA